MSFSRNIADFDKRIILEKPMVSRTAQGGTATTWTTACTVWARILPTSAKEQRQSEQTVMTVSHTISIRYRRDVKASWKIKYKNRYFNIVSMVNPEEAGEWLDMNCKEVAG